jgi:hypothetical protein
MTTNHAASNGNVKTRFLAAPVALFATAILFAGLCGSAAAAKPVSKDGKIHTCYKVKGKAKGSLRVVPAGKKCMKGWRKLAWTATSSIGQSGAGGTSATGAQGASGSGGSGSNGSNGTNGSNGSDEVAVLQTKVAALTLKLQGLEGVLDGVTNGDLTGVVDALGGISGDELGDAVAVPPVLESVCAQASTLTGGLDSVNEGIKDLSILGLPGLSLGNLGVLPGNLPSEYNCPAL